MLRNIRFSALANATLTKDIAGYAILLWCAGSVVSCGGGGGGGGDLPPPTRAIVSELLDPTPGFVNYFGRKVLVLANGNIVVSDPKDSKNLTRQGAVHLYSPNSSTPIASFYGEASNASFGDFDIVALSNSHFVVTSPNEFVEGKQKMGRVVLVDGNTGNQIASIAGDDVDDRLGSEGIVALANDNFLIVSTNDDVAGITDAGSIRLINGSTGEQINMISGDNANDQLGSDTVTQLNNGNYVIVSIQDDVSGVVDAGSVRLMDGSTGDPISTIVGEDDNDRIGSKGIAELGNGNFVIVSPTDQVNGVLGAGSIRLVSSTTGNQIGPAYVGDNATDNVGSDGITVLSNHNFVVASRGDDFGGIVDAGSVALIDGANGNTLGTPIVGSFNWSNVGSGGVVALNNDNYTIASPDEADPINLLAQSGSVRLMNGSTGAQINILYGDDAGDNLGSGGLAALNNSNYVIASPQDTVTVGMNIYGSAGTVRLMDGDSGMQISALVGDEMDDQFGKGSITALENGNFVIASYFSSENGVASAGSLRVINGTTGIEMNSILGDTTQDQPGNGGVIALPNQNILVISPTDDESGIEDTGSVRLLDGNTGTQLGPTLVGRVAFEKLGMLDHLGSNNVTLLNDNVVGIVSDFSVYVINTNTGEVITSIFDESMKDAFVVNPKSIKNYFILSQPSASQGVFDDVGKVRLFEY